MPITWNDFDKIWAVSSPLTPYTFSDLNYAAGWDFIGSTPPARQMWDSLQKANDEKFKFLRDNFGTPNMVTTAAQMTDTDKIYVYVGSEAGWNNGHWYYYDADTSAWVDGGVYNSTAFVTDTTLTEAGKAADAKAVGDALALKADLAGATFTGNVAVNADFSTTGDATVSSDLTVSGVTFLANVTASGNISVTGDIDADNITLSGDISATDVTASGDVAAGALSVSGATTLTGNVTAGADITATGDVTANDASFVNATLSGTLSVAGATTLDGVTAGSVSAQSLNTTGNASVGGTLTVSGATTLDSVTADDITANTLTVSGVSTLSGNVTAGADVTVTGDLSVTNITASGDITADDVTTNGNLSVVGNATLNGTSTAVTPAVDDNSTNIATTAYVQTEIKPIETDVTINDKRISNIEKLLQGNLYDYQTDTDSKYTKTVPQGAMPYASLNSIGGKTLVWNQLAKNSRTSGTLGTLTYTNNGDGSITISGTNTSGSSAIVPLNNSGDGFDTVAGHKYYIGKINGTGTTYYLSFQMGVIQTIITSMIYTESVSKTGSGCYFIVLNGVETNVTISPIVVDLTLMFGAGNEPSTVAEFEAMFPASYYPYNAGTLLSAGVTEVESVGVNVWDEQWKVVGGNRIANENPIAVLPNTQYTFVAPQNPSNGIKFYTLDMVQTGTTRYNAGTFTTPSDCYFLTFEMGASNYGAVYKNDISLNKGTDNTYHPYNAHTMPIPAEVRALDGYGWSAGSVYNYIDFERKVFVQNVGRVDLGTLTWSVRTTSSSRRVLSSTLPSDYIGKGYTSLEWVCDVIYNGASSAAQLIRDVDTVALGVYSYSDNGSARSVYVVVGDTSATTANGTLIYGELATPIETDISSYITDDNLISVEAGGSLTFPNSNGDDYRINVPSSETYMVDLQSAI